MGLCKNHPPHACSLGQHVRACPSSRGAVPEALVPTQVWQPQEAPAWQGQGGGHLLTFRACPQTDAKPELWLETRYEGWGRCVCCVHGHRRLPSTLVPWCQCWAPCARAPVVSLGTPGLPLPFPGSACPHPSVCVHAHLQSSSSVGVLLKLRLLCVARGPSIPLAGEGAGGAGGEHVRQHTSVALPKMACEGGAAKERLNTSV